MPTSSFAQGGVMLLQTKETIYFSLGAIDRTRDRSMPPTVGNY